MGFIDQLRAAQLFLALPLLADCLTVVALPTVIVAAADTVLSSSTLRAWIPAGQLIVMGFHLGIVLVQIQTGVRLFDYFLAGFNALLLLIATGAVIGRDRH